ncbi:hypothetical protein [Humisphaera borealis]|uniref:Uncharacterized protein n=1 Tax=Humisphaera borealis TaxID=2807512 RepID=A0A7M2WSY7_9BACT|nr:hypothetical protein [Humisphaera borealis]QOV88543.1 hypothetical protein IPV69_20200 [Humisphaera borealis]
MSDDKNYDKNNAEPGVGPESDVPSPAAGDDRQPDAFVEAGEGSAEAADSSADADQPIVDDLDTPAHPDEKTIAETEAAFAALHYSGDKGRRKYRGPRSVVILVLVLLGIVGLGIYAVIWSDHLRQKNEKIELRVLEERHVMATWQQRNNEIRQKIYERSFPGEKIAPANSIYKPLSASDKALYDARMAQYGTQFEPDANQKALIEETKKLVEQFRPPTTSPATAASNPAG